MTINVLLERFRFESDLVADTAQATPSRKGLVQLCRELPAHARQAWESLWDLVRERRVDEFQEAGEAFLKSLDGAIKALSSLAKLGESVQGVQADLEQLREEHKERWPWFRKEDVLEALAESARGETLPVDDAFAQIAGVSREEWASRLEERQRRHDQEGG